MLHRNDKRKITAAEDAKPVKQVGYVPRDRSDSLTDTGLTSAGLLGRISPPPEVQFFKTNGVLCVIVVFVFKILLHVSTYFHLSRRWIQNRLLVWRALGSKMHRSTKGLTLWGAALTTFIPSPTP